MGAERVHQEIADLLKEADQELNTNQMKWDKFLVDCFFKDKYFKTSYVVYRFQKLYNINREDFFALKRTPKPIYQHMRVELARFISAFLPTISDVLWKQRPENAAKIALAINKSNVDTRAIEADVLKAKKDRSEMRSSKRTESRTKRKKRDSQIIWNAYKRSNQWGVTK